MDASICDHETPQADCSECVLLAAGVPQSAYPPLIRAARHPDISPLRSLLKNLPAARLDPGRVTWPSSEISNGGNGIWKSPLTEAILAGLPENAALLLEYHADPDGFPNYLFRRFSSCFIRHRPLYRRADTSGSLPPHENLLEMISSPQTGPLTGHEIEARRLSRCRFWAEKDFLSFKSAFKGPVTALEAAAEMGDKETFARLVQAGADTTAWTTEHQGQMPDPAPPSYLTLSTPLHRAIEKNNPEMVAYLLRSHHRPDYFPLSTITRSLNATMYLLTLPSPSPTLLNLLLPSTSLSALTPTYNCHILHIASATLSLPLFQQVAHAVGPPATNLSNLPPPPSATPPSTSPASPSPTPTSTCTRPKSTPASTKSAPSPPPGSPSHSPPTLPAPAAPIRPEPPPPAPRNAATHPRARSPKRNHLAPSPADDGAAQSALVKHLLRARYADPLAALAAQDVHGNTPLHYLAAARDFNEGLWGWVCGMIKRWREGEGAKGGQSLQMGGGGEVPDAAKGYDALIGIRNRWGYCPAELFLENREARGEWGRGGCRFGGGSGKGEWMVGMGVGVGVWEVGCEKGWWGGFCG
ncbi:MAG: hypothetical protein FRX48_01733 [Lasallia pustulata]|uniref:Uncharacterized protein n=1 Tax=Lasallia pustulata TaxID=136370 RepID=A0A5M8Q0W7_9LECA|nr:MAG: hypothetical protein FRX48_01733 [Lasallia pustulata]